MMVSEASTLNVLLALALGLASVIQFDNCRSVLFVLLFYYFNDPNK